MDNNKVLLKAFTSSAGSKVVSFFYQLITLPIIINILQPEKFGQMVVLISLIGWINLISGGVSPYITRMISLDNNNSLVRKVITKSRILLLLASMAVILFSTVVIIFLPEHYNSFKLPSVIILTLSLISFYFGIAESIRQGSSQQHINNIYITLSNLTIMVLIFIIDIFGIPGNSSLEVILLCVFLPPAIFRMINYHKIKNNYVDRINLSGILSKKRLNKIILYFISINIYVQLSILIVKNVSILTLATENIADVAKLEVIFRYLLISGTFFAAIQLPLWPLITAAKKKNEFDWLKKAKLLLCMGFFLYGLINCIFVHFYGEQLLNSWSSNELDFSQLETTLAGIYFLTISIAQAPIIIFMGYGKFKELGKVFFQEAIMFLLIIAIFYLANNSFQLEKILAGMICARALLAVRVTFATFSRM